MKKHLDGVSSVKGRAPNKDEKEQIEIAQKVLACLEGEKDVRWGLCTPPVASTRARVFLFCWSFVSRVPAHDLVSEHAKLYVVLVVAFGSLPESSGLAKTGIVCPQCMVIRSDQSQNATPLTRSMSSNNQAGVSANTAALQQVYAWCLCAKKCGQCQFLNKKCFTREYWILVHLVPPLCIPPEKGTA